MEVLLLILPICDGEIVVFCDVFIFLVDVSYLCPPTPQPPLLHPSSNCFTRS